MFRIFLSYRRRDSRHITERIYDRLRQVFGDDDVFKDTDSIAPGDDFRSKLHIATANCEVMLVIIGKRWLNLQDQHQQRRLDDPQDYVRQEVEAGLNNDEVTVIPVLVDGASMPDATQLPPTLHRLAYLQALTVRYDPDFQLDIQQLVSHVRTQLRNQRKHSHLTQRSLVVGGIALLIFLILAILRPTMGPQTMSPIVPSTTTQHALAESVVTNPDDVNCDNSRMVLIPQTSYFMGLRDNQRGPENERPGRMVEVNPFCIDIYEVTNAQYIACVNDGACTPPQRTSINNILDDYYKNTAFSQFPMVNVTWEQASTFCAYRGGRLTTEAEWELAAAYRPERDEKTSYPWGNQFPTPELARYENDLPVEVGQRPAGNSAYGLMDMAGNVAEWVADWYSPYQREHTINPTGPETGTEKIVRGGAYDDDANGIRSGRRESRQPHLSSQRIGFRCVIPQS